jgi:hypothetical protein
MKKPTYVLVKLTCSPATPVGWQWCVGPANSKWAGTVMERYEFETRDAAELALDLIKSTDGLPPDTEAILALDALVARCERRRRRAEVEK